MEGETVEKVALFYWNSESYPVMLFYNAVCLSFWLPKTCSTNSFGGVNFDHAGYIIFKILRGEQAVIITYFFIELVKIKA